MSILLRSLTFNEFSENLIRCFAFVDGLDKVSYGAQACQYVCHFCVCQFAPNITYHVYSQFKRVVLLGQTAVTKVLICISVETCVNQHLYISDFLTVGTKLVSENDSNNTGNGRCGSMGSTATSVSRSAVSRLTTRVVHTGPSVQG